VKRPTREEVAAEWGKIGAEREVVLEWGRVGSRLQDVVQMYRFWRREGAYSNTAHSHAAEVVENLDPTVDDPLFYAGVLIEWAEREHRTWFWRCCRNHHVL